MKILSSGVIRGKITRQLKPTQVEVELAWPVDVDIFKNFVWRLVGGSKTSRVIKKVDFAKNTVELDAAINEPVEGKTFEMSSNEEVPLLAARLLTTTPLGKPLPPIEMKLGSTRGTNAILERKGASTAFLVTKGFRDLLLIGNQQRKDLFALNVRKTRPLYDLVLEVDERVAADGKVLKKLTKKECQRLISTLRKEKIESIAIALLNSYRNGSHENELRSFLHEAGFKFISLSHELSAQIKILQRSETAVANAYLAPIIHGYVQNIQKGLAGHQLKIMTSAGSLANAGAFHPKDSLLSGPAGGVVGAATAGRLSGIDRLIAFDMGGTSTDVSLYNKRFDYRFECEVGDQKIFSPSVAIQTIAAGGGSICDFDGHRFTVGPQSAGANPGPACYGAGGPFTLTDVNLLLGKLDPQHFAIPVEIADARAALTALLVRVRKRTGKRLTEEEVLEAFLQIANEKMAEAINKVSLQLGHDPSDFTLLSFGGAGGQHACALADMLGIGKILVPYDAGLLSAYGIGHAAVEKFEEQLLLEPFNSAIGRIPAYTDELFHVAVRQFRREGYHEVVLSKKLLFLRFKGQESTIEVEFESTEEVAEKFRSKYEQIYGHWLNDRQVEIESLRIVAQVPTWPAKNSEATKAPYRPVALRVGNYILNGEQKEVKVFHWEALKPGAEINGPAILSSNNSTTLVEDGWRLQLDAHNHALLEKRQLVKKKSGTTGAKAAQIELFTNRFTSIAQDMGTLLQRTSFSVNVKERLDFSCALLDADGYLVVNAPHIPVHLGSMGVCVREVAKVLTLQPGDVAITNHPGYGGSHLPDISLIKAVFHEGRRIGYVANRAHHAEIGGKTPGSMPADASSLAEEGVIIAPVLLVKGGQAQWDYVKSLFTTAPFPTRLLEENLADLNGALAAIHHGEQALLSLCDQFGVGEVTKYMVALRDYAATLLKERLAELPVRTFKALEKLDDGSRLQVKISHHKSRLMFDFAGTSPVHPGNLNATKAIVHSVILYVLRVLVNKPIPMNEGLMQALVINLPTCLLNPHFDVPSPPAVVGGNTEVSQRLTDTLIKALGLAACSQGTMNNFLFGNDRFGYYETICGGTGAGPGFNGTDAVHHHMTNTRITDPEIMELRYPVRVERFEIRKKSGGNGKWKGGCGVVRELSFTQPVEATLLTQHRKEKPFGLKGGEAGACGQQFIVSASGKRISIKGQDIRNLRAGDRIVIKTPGGGGYGKPGPKKKTSQGKPSLKS
ncbi:MAG: hydantoinase B/oxoprolinase family protein [Cyclobacteriaceae bacterium]